MKKIYEIIRSSDDSWNCEVPDKARGKAFNKAFRSYVRKQIKPYGFTLLPSKGSAYCESSGFVADDRGNYVYFSSEDYRFGDVNQVLIRTAKSPTDYTGGANHFCQLYELGREINMLMEDKDV